MQRRSLNLGLVEERSRFRILAASVFYRELKTYLEGCFNVLIGGAHSRNLLECVTQDGAHGPLLGIR
jgi:hypothetical protein